MLSSASLILPLELELVARRLHIHSIMLQVPDGYKMVVSTGPAGNLRRALFPLHKRRPSWQWDYQMTASGDVRLAIQEIARPPTYQPLAGSQPGSEGPFVYMI